jgi:hypothetical protein
MTVLLRCVSIGWRIACHAAPRTAEWSAQAANGQENETS